MITQKTHNFSCVYPDSYLFVIYFYSKLCYNDYIRIKGDMMNKKTVLFLINGFGVEKKESYSIYDASLMPTFENLMKTQIL